jgi:ketosteroid isomerase-like protein
MERNAGRIILPLILLMVVGFTQVAEAQPLNKDNFHEYLAALESLDTDALRTRFYHEDFTIELGAETMDVADLLEYETNLATLVDFHFEVSQIVADESGIAIDAVETFNVKQDADVPILGPSRVGEQYEAHLNVFYGLRAGKIVTIKAYVISVEKIE